MKILHLASHNGVYRGGAVQICRIAIAQKRMGHDVAIICNRLLKHSKEQRERDLKTWEPVMQEGIPVRKMRYYSLRGIPMIRRILRKEGFEIVHAHRDQALEIAWFATWGFKRPVVVAQRGTISVPPRLTQRAFRSPRVRAVIAVAKIVKDILVREVRVEPAKIHVVYGSVDMEQFTPRPARLDLKKEIGIPSEALVIGSLAAYDWWKGFQVFLPALAKVMAENQDVYAVFIGSKVKTHLNPIAEDLGIAGRCRFFEHQTNVPDWISFMDLTVVASTEKEGLSGVLRESLAMEVPVVSTNQAGNNEIVRDGETGLLVPRGSVEYLARKMIFALAHPRRMKAMARKGRRWVMENATLEVQAKRILEVYRNLLEWSPLLSETAF